MLDSLLNLLRHGNQLKRTPRTGWLMRGIPDAENVAAHSFGVAFSALILAPFVEEALDLERLLALAIIHDLPEAITTDIPAPVWRHMPNGIKSAVETPVLGEMIDEYPHRTMIESLWDELQTNRSAEARFVHEVDKLEMFLQADQYEKQFGNQQLAEFWANPRQFSFPIVQQLYDTLYQQRRATSS